MNPEQTPYSIFDRVGGPIEGVHIGGTTKESREEFYGRALNGGAPASSTEAPQPQKSSVGDKINTYVQPANPFSRPPRLSADINNPPTSTSKE